MSTLTKTAKKIPSKIRSEFFLLLKGLWNHFRALEVSIICLLFWWAIVLLLPLDIFYSSNSYQAMKDIASQKAWGVSILVIAIINLVGLVKRHQKLRMIGLLLAMGLWVFVATMFAVSSVVITATGTYAIVAALNGYVYIKVGERSGKRREYHCSSR